MSDLGVVLTGALLAGLLASAIRLPPLIGFLTAGFVLNAAGFDGVSGLDTLADLGVALLLFTIGLKLDVRVLGRREIWLTSVVHMLGFTMLSTGVLALLALTGLGFLGGQSLAALATVGFALSFSSTVLVIKALEQQSAVQSGLGQIAIGILLIQDVAAVVFLTIAEGKPPSPWAVLLVLLIPAMIPIRAVLKRIDHGELMPLVGVVLALGPGYALFDAVGLKGDLGALLLGLLLAADPRAGELAKSLFSLKELLLIAFFVSIGFTGLPSMTDLIIAAVILALIVTKSAGYLLLLRRLGVRHRTSVRASVVLGNYSEFGLIVLAVGVSAGLVEERWLVVLATALAAASLGSVVGNQYAEPLIAWSRRILPSRHEDRLLPGERSYDVAHADAVVIGMGRVGQAAYRQLSDEYGLHVIGIENREDRVKLLCADGMEIIEADATDPEMWDRLRQSHDLDIAVLAMPFHGANVRALELLRASDFTGTVATITQYDDEADEMRTKVNAVLGLYDGAGTQLADDAAEQAGLPRTGEGSY